jgi:hypothetical protein
MHGKRLVPVSAVAALAGVLVVCGCTSAAITTSTSRSPGAAPSTSGRPAGRQTSTSGGLVHITGYSDSDGPKSTVILTGAIGDFGQAVRTGANGPAQQYNRLNLAFTHGSFKLSIVGLEHNLVSAFGHFPSNTSTCSGIVTVTATTPIVASSGTGAYKGVSGNFKMTVTIAEVDSWPKCPVAGPDVLLAEDIFITGAGTVSFG